MKLLEGIIYTRDMKKLVAALESMGLIVNEIMYDRRRTVSDGILEGIACVYNLLNRVKIRTVISDELVATMMETLRSFGNCEFVIIPKGHICPA